MDKKIENLIAAAKNASACLKSVGNHDREQTARVLDVYIHEIESGDLVKRLKHIKRILEDPWSQFLLIDDNSDSTRADLLEVVDYYLNLHKSE